MSHSKKAKPTRRDRGPGRRSNVALTAKQFQNFIGIWNGVHGGHKEFAKEMVNLERPDVLDIAIGGAVASKIRGLHRIEDRETGISPEMFKSVADVFGITTDELREQLSSGKVIRSHTTRALPWKTDEAVLTKHRAVLHFYHQVGRGNDLCWVYLPLKFTERHNGYLYTSISLDGDPKIEYKAYGYISRKLLTLILRRKIDREETESVHLFRDFIRLVREPSGCCGIAVHDDQTYGVEASLIFKTSFPYAEVSGKQNHVQSHLLDQYWKSFQREPSGPSIGKVLKIVSGGQTGADRAAWEFAKENGIPHGGWIPLGRKAEDERIPKEWDADETETAEYDERTERNVSDSDGTVVFSLKPTLYGGSKKTIEFAKRHEPERKCLHINKRTDDPAGELARFIKKNKIGKLNVAGPRASEEKEVGNFVKAILMVATRLLLTNPAR